MQFPILNTERLRLIQVTKEHTRDMYDIMSRDEVTKYYGMDSLNNIDEAAKIIDSFQTTYESNRGIRWGITLRDEGDFIGTIGLNNLNIKSKKAEVGYELHPSFWGRGITTEAVKEVLDYCFEELDLFRIGAVTYPQNKPSIQLLKKFGFQKEGVLRGYLYQNNESHDVCVFSLLQTEWG